MPPRAHVTDPAKLLPPILRLLEQIPPDAYSAQQKARTTAARLLASAHYDSAIEVLFGSTKELLKLREWGSGCDLAVYLVQAYEKGEIEVTDESKGMQGSEVVTIILIPGKARLMQLLALIDGEGPWRKKVADAAIKYVLPSSVMLCADHPSLDGVRIWEIVLQVIRICTSTLESSTTKVSNISHTVPMLIRATDRQFPQAEHHLLASCKRDPASMLADMMFEWYVVLSNAFAASSSCSSAGLIKARVILEHSHVGSSFRVSHHVASHCLAEESLQ